MTHDNPFKVFSPEQMSAEQVVRLFVPVAEELEIGGPEHVFLHGHRGCGKSMMLRRLAPDCQSLIAKAEVSQLPFLGIYVTVKATGLDVTEYERVGNEHAGLVLAEHSLVSFLAANVFQSLSEHCPSVAEAAEDRSELQLFLVQKVCGRLKSSGVDIEAAAQRLRDASSTTESFGIMVDLFNEIYGISANYLRRSAFKPEHLPYAGPLLGYREILFPLLCELAQLSFMPKGRCIYVLLDDADNLNRLQTLVLNTWISFRTGNRVAFKVSTQLNYKTYLTVSGQRIDAAHDFKEINASSIHTGLSSVSSYPVWVKDIIGKRLADHRESNGASFDVHHFFPPDIEQEEKIAAIASEIRKRSDGDPRKHRPGDEAYRYARADYIKSLGGTAKQSSNYRYAGFDQLVHISSGIIRYFLDNAAEMYAIQEVKNQKANSTSVDLSRIDPSVQDEVVREAADQLMIGRLDQLEREARQLAPEEASDFVKLRNLVKSLGAIFYEILVSDRSERRVISIALSDDPPEEVMRVLSLGVRHGLFYQAAIGSKEGRWRTKRYVMTRRLAPHFKLDPMGFAGYLFVTSDLLTAAMTNPRQAVNRFLQERLGTVISESQLAFELEP